MTRKPCCNAEGLKKGAWTEEEDKKLIADIQEHGEGNWHLIPPRAGLKRCGKSCRLRWNNYLKPDIKRGDFTYEEDQMIIKLHISCGNKWSAIARQLPGRTDNEIKNYWNTYLKKWLIKKRIETLTDKPSDSASGSKNCPGPSDQAPSPRPAPLTRDVVSQSLNAGALASESLGRNKNLESKKGFSRSSSTSRLLNKMATRVSSLKGLISASPQQIHDNSLIGIDNVISPSYDLDTYIGYSYEGVNSSDRTYSVPMETDVQDVLALDVLNAFDVQDALSTSIEEEDAFGIMDDWSEFVLEQPVEIVEEYYNNDQRSHI